MTNKPRCCLIQREVRQVWVDAPVGRYKQHSNRLTRTPRSNN